VTGCLLPAPYQFEGFQLDVERYELRRNGRVLKLEKIPMELLILLISRQGKLVSREEIVEKLWGRDVFIETEHGINTAIRKIRQALGDDPENPRFVRTLKGKGYREARTCAVPSSSIDSSDGSSGTTAAKSKINLESCCSPEKLDRFWGSGRFSECSLTDHRSVAAFAKVGCRIVAVDGDSPYVGIKRSRRGSGVLARW